ncbi:MAG TPA: glycosyltransferase family 4 protein, partial [Steroidobacteraceae bacterium]|nr:glycosyltransferase family 4 protein [Steroidobacteraceae bacterium]
TAATNIVLGERMRDFVAQLGVANEQLRIIPNWADLDAATPKRASDSELRTRLELQSAFIVGYSGNLGRAHEFFTMLEAASLLHKDHDIVFLIIGGGASLDALKRAVQQRDLHNFRFLPYQPRESLPDTLAAADVHWLSLLPALEGLIVPSKLYGIFASHRPAIFIGDPDGEAARIIASAQAGIAVAPGNSGLLAEQIARLKSDFNAREIMGQNGYRLYRDRFTAETALAEWTAVLTDQRDSNTSAQRAVKAANVKRPPSSTVDLPRVRR